MDKVNGDRIVTPAVNQFRRDSGITLADKEWSAFSAGLESPWSRIPATTPLGQPAGRGSDPLMPWRAADRALAEIAAANRSDMPSSSKDRARLERATATVRDALGEAAAAAAEAARRALALAEALDDALTTLNQVQSRRTPPGLAPVRRVDQPSGVLSQREQEVLMEVARGRTNKAIADALYVSPNTVKTHVASLLRKLNVDSRAQLAAIAVQQGM